MQLRNRRAPYQLWQCVLNVVLIEGTNLLSMEDNGLSDPYVKFRLENERYRSKTIRRSVNPRCLEQFQLYIYSKRLRPRFLNGYTNRLQLLFSLSRQKSVNIQAK